MNGTLEKQKVKIVTENNNLIFRVLKKVDNKTWNVAADELTNRQISGLSGLMFDIIKELNNKNE